MKSVLGLVVVLTLASPAVGTVAEAQPPGKVPRIGVISEFSPAHPFIAAFRQGLRDLGYTEGQNIVVANELGREVGDSFERPMRVAVLASTSRPRGGWRINGRDVALATSLSMRNVGPAWAEAKILRIAHADEVATLALRSRRPTALAQIP